MATDHPDGCYWVSKTTGTIQRQCDPLLAVALGQVGFVGSNGLPPGEGGTAFTTFAAAKAFADSSAGQSPGRQAEQSLSGPFHSWEQAVGAIAGFFRALTDATVWRSVGWLLLGAALMVAGIMLWLKKSGAIPDVVPVPV